MTDLFELARVLKGNGLDSRLRQAVVSAVDTFNGNVTIKLAGSSIEIPNIKYLSSYSPSVNDTVWAYALDSTYLVLGKTSTGSSSGGWAVKVNEPGTSFANWTALAGTWSSSGTYIQQTNSASSYKNAYMSNPLRQPATHAVLDAEIMFPSTSQGGSTLHAGLALGYNRVAPGFDDPHVRISRPAGGAGSSIDILKGDQVQLASTAVAINLDTWHKVRMLVRDRYIAAHLDGVLLVEADLLSDTYEHFDSIGLVTYGSNARYRNIRYHVPALPSFP